MRNDGDGFIRITNDRGWTFYIDLFVLGEPARCVKDVRCGLKYQGGSRSDAWLEAEEYILTKLADEHAPDGGCRGLPLPARTHAFTVGLFYDDLGKLVAHGMIDQSLVIGSYGTPIVRLWDALVPYVYAERQAHALDFWVYFEDLAVRTAETSPGRVYAKIGLRSRPPRPASDAAGGASSAVCPGGKETSGS